MPLKVPVEISARHIHLRKKDLEALFGKGYSLTKIKNLTQPWQFAVKERIAVRFKEKEIDGIRVVSPIRPKTQLEISITDAYFLGIRQAIRRSGDLKGTPGILLIGPKGRINLKKGVIVPWRHIHMSFKDAKKFKVKNNDFVSVKIKGLRETTFHKTRIRVEKNFKLSMHLDADEGNAAGIPRGGEGEILNRLGT